jgi:hypothetical protein
VTRLALALCALSLATGCVDRSHVGYFDDHAFYHVRQHYRVRYAPEGRGVRALLGPDWRPLNIRYEDGLPSECRWAPEDRTKIYLDADGDGRSEVQVTAERFDLQFEHRQSGATVLARTTPIAHALRDRRLDVLVHEILERVASSSSRGPGAVEVTRVLHEGPATVGGAEAYHAIFEGAALGPTGDVIARSTDRAHLVLVRPTTRWFEGGADRSGRSAPMIVSFWLVSRREHFDSLDPAFSELLGRIDFHEP